MVVQENLGADPEFSYWFLFDEVTAAGHKGSERTVWKICSDHEWWCVFGKKRRGKKGKVGAPAHEAIAVHSPEFTGALLALAREFVDPRVVSDLEDAFNHYRVPTLPFEVVQEAMRKAEQRPRTWQGFSPTAHPRSAR